MIKCIHFICRKAQTVVAVKHPVYEPGNWDPTREDAEKLVGGRVFLHTTRSKHSHFGGQVEDCRVVDTDRAHEHRIIFTLSARVDCKGEKWRGAKHAMAWTRGVIRCDG
jgi:hypothetical protein